MWLLGLMILLTVNAFAGCPSHAPCIQVSSANEDKFEARPVVVIPLEEDSQELDLDLITFARGFIGTPYIYGGDSENGIDCSAFIQKVFMEFEINLPRTSREQYRFSGSEDIPLEEIKPNDLLFFKTENGDEIDHVAMYVGDGKMIHSSKMENGVQITDFKFSKFWSTRFASAKRITREKL